MLKTRVPRCWRQYAKVNRSCTLLGLLTEQNAVLPTSTRGLRTTTESRTLLSCHTLETQDLVRRLSVGHVWTRVITPFSITVISSYATNTPSQIPESHPPKDPDQQKTEPKPSLWQRFKQMYKEYWYVVLPVHTVTSIFWYGSFYYMARSGIDIVPLLKSLGASEWILKKMTETGAGYFAVAYGMYKIATPARYTVTLTGTTITINYLKKWGYIKPMPSGEQMKAMLRERGKQLRSSRAKVLAKMNLRRKGTVKSKEAPDEEKK